MDLTQGSVPDLVYNFRFIKRRKCLIPSPDSEAIILISNCGLVSQDFFILARKEN